MIRHRRSRLLGLGPGGWTLALAALHVLLGLLVYEPVLLANGDNAGYMILGEVLRTGEGYRDLHLPGAPVHVKFPPLYPALLAGLGFVGGLQLFKAASLALTAAAVALATRLGHRWMGLRGGVLGGLLVAANPLLLEYGHHVMSEALFTALLLFGLYAVHRSLDGGAGDGTANGPDSTAGVSTERWWWLGLAAAAAAFLTRTVGVALLLGVTLSPLLRRDIRRFAAGGGATVVAAGGWALFQDLAAPERAGYLKEWVMVHPYDPAAGTVGITGMFERIAMNLWTYVSWLFPSSVTGLAEGYAGGGRLVALLGLGLAALVLAGWLARSRPRPGAAEITTFVYVAILAAWPSLWLDRRFLVPVVPLLLLYLLVGSGTVSRVLAQLRDRLAKKGARERTSVWGTSVRPLRGPALVGALAVAVALALPSGARLGARAPDRVECMRQYRAGTPCQPPAFRSFFEAAAWASGNTPEDAVFISAKPRLFYLKSGRRSRIYRYSDEPDRVLRDIEAGEADFVVVDDLPGIGGTTERYLCPAVEAYPERFTLVYEGGEPPTSILRVRDRSTGKSGP